MKEIWTTEAKNTFAENIKYLKKRWTINEVNGFVEKSFEVIDLILKTPEIGRFDEQWNAHKFLIVPQIYLFFDIKDDAIILLSFWNNFQKPLG